MAAIEYRIVEATPDHADHVAQFLRDADAAEVFASHGLDARTACRLSVVQSIEAWAGLADGEPVCLFGVAPVSLVDGEFSPWMLGAKALDRHAGAFLRRNRAMVRRWRRTYPVLFNQVDARNRASIRWLRWLGFEIGPPQPSGILGLPFHTFTCARIDPCASPSPPSE